MPSVFSQSEMLWQNKTLSVEFIQDVTSKIMFRLLCIDFQSLYACVL